jgi:hypothetical protein
VLHYFWISTAEETTRKRVRVPSITEQTYMITLSPFFDVYFVSMKLWILMWYVYICVHRPRNALIFFSYFDLKFKFLNVFLKYSVLQTVRLFFILVFIFLFAIMVFWSYISSTKDFPSIHSLFHITLGNNLSNNVAFMCHS